MSQVYEKHDSKNVDAFIVTDRENDKNFAIDRVLCGSILEANVADLWITDSGASGHITFRREWFCDFRECSNVTVTLGDDEQCLAPGVETILIRKFVNGRWENGRIENVLYVSKL